MVEHHVLYFLLNIYIPYVYFGKTLNYVSDLLYLHLFFYQINIGQKFFSINIYYKYFSNNYQKVQ